MPATRTCLVDEYQDLAPGLHRIVTSLSLDEGNSTLLAVGDPDQAIYGWTGTRPELLLELADRETVHRVDLRINYRCGALIAAAGRRILGGEGAEAVTMRGGGSVSARHEPAGLTAQANYMAGRILELQADGAPLHEVAVLAPTNDDCDELVDVLRKHDIPVAWRADAYSPSPLTMTMSPSPRGPPAAARAAATSSATSWTSGSSSATGQRYEPVPTRSSP